MIVIQGDSSTRRNMCVYTLVGGIESYSAGERVAPSEDRTYREKSTFEGKERRGRGRLPLKMADPRDRRAKTPCFSPALVSPLPSYTRARRVRKPGLKGEEAGGGEKGRGERGRVAARVSLHTQHSRHRLWRVASCTTRGSARVSTGSAVTTHPPSLFTRADLSLPPPSFCLTFAPSPPPLPILLPRCSLPPSLFLSNATPLFYASLFLLRFAPSPTFHHYSCRTVFTTQPSAASSSSSS